MNSLNIWVDDIFAATLSEENNTFSLTYTDVWNTSGYAFSPHLPLSTLSSGASVRNFFSNLLPEGNILEGMSQVYQVSKYNVFGILSKIGKDCAGALILTLPEETITEANNRFTIEYDYQEISEHELDTRIEEANVNNTPVMMWNMIPRMSLAGVQNKLGIYIDKNDKLYLPVSSAPTSHILKPDNVDGPHPNIAANEYFCMQLASRIGLNVPDTSFRNLPTPIFLIKRYDRVWTWEGQLIRSHQIDGCQALNLPPNLKYQQEYRDGPQGATIKDLLQLSNICKVPAIAQQQILLWLLFNYIIGNSDAHAKNISFLINHHQLDEKNNILVEQGMKVAPFYDLVCGRAYDYFELAQSIGGENQFSLITRLEWKQFANDCDISFVALQKIANILVSKVKKALPELSERIKQETKQPIIETITEVINTHCDYLVESLIS
ncbi:HipA domain-containing protein [Methylotenera sp. L2L1]|jgi:serine/threonine-protein kinase HipA|uniref:HipA domain-containing protein n=1 Tax=Methylotenera sp. L2L1 TaxID=1502770 RepID=UPI0005614C30|nr:HipA domain-containing protein [Methylotenera sp. L2L1]